MNAPFTASSVWNALWLTLAGLVFGGLAAIFIYTAEKPVYESTCLCRPLRPAGDTSGISHREWLNTEVTAMGSHEQLRRVTRNLNLAVEWKLSEDECVKLLKERLDIRVLPDTTLIRISAKGSKSMECASLVNAVVGAREEFYEQSLSREPNFQASIRAARVTAVSNTADRKRTALLDAMNAMNIQPDNNSDKALMNLTLPRLLEEARRDWFAETIRLEEAKAAGMSSTFLVPPYAEILERGAPAVNPLEIQWLPRASSWSLIGGATGLLLGILAGLVSRKSGPPLTHPQPVMAGEY